MKNLKRILIGLVLMTTVLTSCKKEEPIEPCTHTNTDSEIVEMKIEINGTHLSVGYENVEMDIVRWGFYYTDENGDLQEGFVENLYDTDDDINELTFKFNKNEYYSFYFASGEYTNNMTIYNEGYQNWNLYLDGELWYYHLNKKSVFYENTLSFNG